MYEIGKIQPKDSPLSEMTEGFGDTYKYLFKIIFNLDNDSCSYEKISVEEIDQTKKNRYLYRIGESNAPAVTPISKITKPEKTFNTKILKSVDKFLENIRDFAGEPDIAFLTSLDKELTDKKGLILNDFKTEFSKFDIGPKNAGVLGIIFNIKGEEKYLGDLDVFSSNLPKTVYKSNYFKFKTASNAFDKTCYMCKALKKEVWGYAGTFQFYTVDKKGMVTGGFDQSKAWKNYPLCPECYIILERGKKYVLNNLSYRFCGFNYFLIPKLVLVEEENLKKVLTKLRGYKDFTLEKKESEKIVELEEKVFDYLQDKENYANFDFLFFEEPHKNVVFNILLYLENITPTRLATIMKAKHSADDEANKVYKIFTKIPKKDDKGELTYFNIDFTFHAIRNFFLNSEIEGNFDKYFLDIIKNIFFLELISLEYLLNRFMEKIRSEFLNENSVFYLTLSAYKILRFLEELKILNRRRFKYMNSTGKYEDFFTEQGNFFDDESKKAVFLEGVLVQKLLNIQLHERKAQPFRSRLNGLKIDEKIARRLLPETINKLEEYDSNYYKEMESEISGYFLKSDLSRFSTEELSFYFVLGMNLAGQFDKKENVTGKNDKTENKEVNNE